MIATARSASTGSDAQRLQRHASPAAPRRTCVAALVTLAALAAPVAACRAQAVQPREAWEDTKAYFTAPLRWDARDWAVFGGTVAAIGVAAQFDEDVRGNFVDDDDPTALDGRDPGGTDDAIPAAVLVAGTWLLAGITDDPGGWRELGSMLQAGALTAVTVELGKLAFGRVRPNETADSGEWFDGGDSFPSLHSGAAFAIGTVFAESGDDRYRWLRRVVGYGVAGYTAYARVDHNAHWMSDTLAGAAIGYSTARFTMRRRESGDAQPRASAMVVPLGADGVMLTVAVPLR
jgi:membrane-associated phospholipid phosphatase